MHPRSNFCGTTFTAFTSSLLLSVCILCASADAGEQKKADSGTIMPIWNDPISGMEFVLIKGDCYLMGSPEEETGRGEDEIQHKVCIEDFWLSKYEVTNKQFAVFIAENQYATTSERKGEGFGISQDGADDWGWKQGISWKHPLWPKDTIMNKMDHPVTQISWNDAQAFLRWLTDKHKGENVFRLPHEGEWEYACRAGTTTARYWGNSSDHACNYASVADDMANEMWPDLSTHNCSDGYVTTAPIGKFRPNNWGLHDMLGNVWEMTEDVYGDYDQSPIERLLHVDPNPLQVMRGGSWIYGPAYVRCAFRNVISRTGRSYSTGFRAVRKQLSDPAG